MRLCYEELAARQVIIISDLKISWPVFQLRRRGSANKFPVAIGTDLWVKCLAGHKMVDKLHSLASVLFDKSLFQPKKF